MKTLYLSDLDGTLLTPNAQVSRYTADTINRFVQNGGCFSYATARSIVSASRVTAGLHWKHPVICYNGAFINDPVTHSPLISNFFTADEAAYARRVFTLHNIFPIVFAFINGTERVSYIPRHMTPAMQVYFDMRPGDVRFRPVGDIDALFQGDIIHFLFYDPVDALPKADAMFKANPGLISIISDDVYANAPSGDLMSSRATKASAALKLKDMLGCGRLVVFGDAPNDISMFQVADECYAPANAAPELREIATAVIGSNSDDGVARWIAENKRFT